MLCRLIAAGCLLAALPQAAAAQNAPAAPSASTPPVQSAPAAADESETMTQPEVGDHWSYEVHDLIKGTLKLTNTFTVTDVTPTEVTVRYEAIGNPLSGYVVYDRSWDAIKTPMWKFSPNDGTGLKLPLNAGNSWKFHNNGIVVQHNVSYHRSGTSKVIGKESVTTGAGTFDTFKIETSYDARNVNDPTKREFVKVITWYAPSIDHWVKQTIVDKLGDNVLTNTSSELVDYGRRD